MRLESDIVIIGSGVGGATAAKELTAKGKKVLIVEKGYFYPTDKIGSEPRALKFYDKFGIWSKSKEGVAYYRSIMAGGTAVISCGNGVRSLENEFKNLGMDLTEEFIETEKELAIKPVPDSHIGLGTKKILTAAKKTGFEMAPMPKYINFVRCVSCGNCVLGCCPNAKWTALEYLKAAQDKKASLLTGVNITRAMISNNRVIGVTGRKDTGEKIEIRGSVIILAAGGIGTPIILQNSGIKAGRKLFLDMFNVTSGVIKDAGTARELTMAAVWHGNEGFILSPFLDCALALASTIPLNKILKVRQRRRMLGIMVKINDDCIGGVSKNGVVRKAATSSDMAKLNKGTDISREILITAGADPKTLITTRIRGAHPGGTAAIGEVVNKNLETKIKGLFVCDASVLPQAPGLPPILTIIALAKRFAKRL